MKGKWIRIVLLTIFLVQALQLVHWVRADSMPPSWDQSWHAMISISQYNQFLGIESGLGGNACDRFPILNWAKNFYPPGFHTTTIPFYLLFGVSYDSAVLTNILYLLVLIACTYLIAWKIFDEKSGLIASFIISTIPVINVLMMEYLIDFSLTAMVAAGLTALLYTENFRNLKYSLLFGIVFGVGTLVKWNYFMYLIAPFAYTLMIFIKQEIIRGRRYFQARNIVLAALTAILIASLWYTPGQIQVTFPAVYYAAFNQGMIEGEPNLFTSESLTHYVYTIIHDYSLFYSIILLIGLGVIACSWRKIENQRGIVFLIITVLGIYFFSSMLWNKNNRYIVPIYIPLTVLSSIGLSMVGEKRWGRIIIGLMVIGGFASIFALNTSLIDSYYFHAGVSIFDFRGKYPNSPEVSVESILDSLNDSAKGNPFTTCITVESENLNDVNIPYYAFKDDYPVKYIIGNGCNPLEYDYVIYGPIEKTWRSHLFKESEYVIRNNPEKFQEIFREKEVVVYKRK
ncbi:MAG: glycosyltransferase family 39 protein [Methanobacteriota archaeon]